MRLGSLITMLLAAALLSATAPNITARPLLRASAVRQAVNLLDEGFETGLGDWLPQDGTAPGNWSEAWTLSDSGAYSGQSWWMHDPAIGGYTNHRYIVLDTPDVTLPSGSPTLTFQIAWAMETLGGTGAFNGWDGVDVRLSTNGGETWQVITGSPAYTAGSLYSFGNIFNEGTNVPGWTDSSNGWQSASFSLASWAGQTVRIRFAFASDDATATDDGGSTGWFGARIDDINVAGVFTSNGDGASGDSQMTSGFAGVVSGDYWTLEQGAHNGGAAMYCPVEPDLRDELVSPVIAIGYDISPVLTYSIRADLPDTDGDDDGCPDDYFEVYAKSTGEVSWTRLHWLSGAGGADWTQVGPGSGNYTGDCDLSTWLGHSIQLKFVVVTDDNNDGGTGLGVWLDDINLSYGTHLSEPVSLTASYSNGSVQLAWSEPTFSNRWMHWDDGECAQGVGVDEHAELEAAAKYRPIDLNPYEGCLLTRVRFFPMESNCDYSIRIRSGENRELIREQSVPSPDIAEWNEVILDEPVAISADMTLWIGYLADANRGFPLGCDNGPVEQAWGAWIHLPGYEWMQLTEAESTLDGNWNIQGCLESPDGRAVPLWPYTPHRSDELSGYVIYRGTDPTVQGDELAVIYDPELLDYTDDNPVCNDENFYWMSAWYNGDQEQESSVSNRASAFAPSSTMTELSWDDGHGEGNLTLQAGEAMATRFTLNGTMAVRQVEVYLAGYIYEHILPVRVWADDDGLPGEVLSDFAIPAEWLHSGWNILDLPHGVQVSGAFRAGVLGVSGGLGLAADISAAGHSCLYDGEWNSMDAVGPMIRVWADSYLSTIDDPVTPSALSLGNYPNPFNPETTVSFSLSAAGHARLDVYNVRGQRVATLLNERCAAGDHSVSWKADGMASGVYLLRLQTDKGAVTRKTLLLK